MLRVAEFVFDIAGEHSILERRAESFGSVGGTQGQPRALRDCQCRLDRFFCCLPDLKKNRTAAVESVQLNIRR